MQYLEAGEGFQEILFPPTEFKDIEYEFRHELQNMLEKTVPQPQIIPQTKVEYMRKEDRIRFAHELLYGINQSRKVNEAVKIYKQEADNQDVNSFNCLGQLYMEGKLVQQDIGQSLIYYEKSCEKDNAEGWYRMGRLIEAHDINTSKIFIINSKLRDRQQGYQS